MRQVLKDKLYLAILPAHTVLETTERVDGPIEKLMNGYRGETIRYDLGSPCCRYSPSSITINFFFGNYKYVRQKFDSRVHAFHI